MTTSVTLVAERDESTDTDGKKGNAVPGKPWQ